MLWGAAWLRRASQGESYLNYIQTNIKTLGADDNINEFGWDNKHAGLNVLVSKVNIDLYKHGEHFEFFSCFQCEKLLNIVVGSLGREHVLSRDIQSISR